MIIQRKPIDREAARVSFEEIMFQYRAMKTKLRMNKPLAEEDEKHYSSICSQLEKLVGKLKRVQKEIITAKYMGDGAAHDKTIYSQLFAEKMTWKEYRELEEQAFRNFSSRIIKDKRLLKLFK